MVESMRGAARRDLHQTPIRTKAEAEQFAQTDVQWIREHLAIDSASLSAVKIDIWFTASSQGPGNQEYIRYYWEALFEEMGITDVYFK